MRTRGERVKFYKIRLCVNLVPYILIKQKYVFASDTCVCKTRYLKHLISCVEKNEMEPKLLG